MANELERRVLELLAAELERRGYAERAQGIREGKYQDILVSYDVATKALTAALQQAQQPGAQAVASSKPWDIDALIAAVHEYEEMRAHGDADDIDDALMGVMLAMPDDTAPPPLPEVSEEDVHNALTKWSRLGLTTRVEPHARMRAALESYRARLAEKGGV